MTPELNKALCARFPLLFQQHGKPIPDFGLAVGDGWHGLLETLCELLYAPYVQARDAYERARKNEGTAPYRGAAVVTAVDVERARLAMAEAEAQLPRVVQVKEKFGTLRFYADRATEQAYAYINFAEHMSGRVCEECGAPGRTRGRGWIRTLCDTHHAEQEARRLAQGF